MKAKTRIIRCPRCRKSCLYDQKSPYRPFCSRECKNGDIISWVNEEFKIPGKPTDERSSDTTHDDSDAQDAF